MAMENKRIIQLNTERTTPAADDYVMVDSATAGTAKYLLPKITDAIDQEISDRTSADTTLQTAITNEATARTNADTTLQGNITAEATARAAADTAINGEITQLKEDLNAFYVESDPVNLNTWEQGYINITTGGDGSGNDMCRTPIQSAVRLFYSTKISVSVVQGLKCAVYEYSTLSSYVGRVITYQSGEFSFESVAGHYYRFVIRNVDGSDLLVANIPENAVSLTQMNRTDKTLSISGAAADAKSTGDSLAVTSSNVLNPATLSENTYINAYGGESTNTAYATTDYIPVESGDVVVVTAGNQTSRQIMTAVAYNASKTRISGTAEEAYSYTVPNGASYIRICLNQSLLTDDTRINIKGVREIYEPYYTGKVSEYVEKNRTDIFKLFSLPIESLPAYIRNGLIYKPLGNLSKGYICFTSDDGNTGDATYTIPTFISKGVPCTLALFKGSQILQTQEGIALVKNAVENYDFCVAQHSGSYWTEWNEYQLNTFFDSEKEYFDSIDIPLYGAVNPGMETTDICRIVAGNRFGTFRTDYTEGKPYYDRYISGPRSNMNSLPSQNLVDLGLDSWKDKCDKTLANHWLMMIHFHGNQIDQTVLALLENVIDYAINIGLTFVAQKDIPNLI